MTTTLDTSCSENGMVLSAACKARVSACMYFLVSIINENFQQQMTSDGK